MTLALGCVLFGLHLHWSTVPLSIPVMGLALLSFLPFGLLFAALTVAVKQGSVGTSWVIALLSILGGLYFPVALLPRVASHRRAPAAVHLGDEPAAPSAGRLGRGANGAVESLLKMGAVRGGPRARLAALALRRDPLRPTSRDDHRVLMAQRVEHPIASRPESAVLLASRITVPQHVVYRTFPSETVVLNLHTGRYHGLNVTAGRMLMALEASASVREAVGVLARSYGEDVLRGAP